MAEENANTYLSDAERRYNEAVVGVGQQHLIKSAEKTHTGAIKLWIFALVFTVISIIYFFWATRDEVQEAYEDGVESLFNQPYAKVGDPAFERFARVIGTYSAIVKKPVTAATVVGTGGAGVAGTSGDVTAPNPTPVNESAHSNKHASLGQLFTIDILSESLTKILFGAMGKVFGR